MIDRRGFLGKVAGAGTGWLLADGFLAGCATRPPPAAPSTVVGILHTNDLHAHFLGVGPARDHASADPAPDAAALGGYARLATLLRERREALEVQGPALILDAGDFTTGTAQGAASRLTGAELRAMGQMGYDATTLGNHELDFGPEGLGQMLRAAVDAGPIPPIVIANLRLDARSETLGDLRRLTHEQILRPHLLIVRAGVRIGILGVIGHDAQTFAVNAGAVRFDDPVDTAREVARRLREEHQADVVVCLSHGGLQPGADGKLEGEDLELAKAVPEIDVVVSGHTHTLVERPLVTAAGTVVVQAQCYGQRLGELVLAVGRGLRQVRSYRSHVVGAGTAADPAMTRTVESVAAVANRRVFAAYGYDIHGPLAIVERDLPSVASSAAESTSLANLVTDAIRQATRADIGFTVNGALLAGLLAGRTGVQTVQDVFAIAPLGSGLGDPSAGGALVTMYITGRELKNLFEFFLDAEGPRPARHFPHVSGVRVRYGAWRPRHRRVTVVEQGDGVSGHRPIDTSGATPTLFSLSCSAYLGLIVAAIPRLTGGELALTPKTSLGEPMAFRVDGDADPRRSPGPYLLPPRGQIDPAAAYHPGQAREIKEWEAIVEHLAGLREKSAMGVSIVRPGGNLAQPRVVPEE